MAGKRRGTATGDAPGASPLPAKSHARGRTVEGASDSSPIVSSSATIRARLREAEELLATTKDRPARYELARRWGITSRHAARYVQSVRRIWDVEAGADPEKTRNALRARLEGVLCRVIDVGFDRKRGMVDTTGAEHEFKDPDLRSVLGAVDALARFGGITEPVTVDARSVHLHGASDAATLQRIRRAYFGDEPAEPAALPEAIDVEGET